MAGREWQRLIAGAACASLVSAVACRGGNGANDSATSTGDVMRADSAATATTPEQRRVRRRAHRAPATR